MTNANLDPNQLAHHHINQNQPSGWFEPLYANANWDQTAIPWAGLGPSPDLTAWLNEHRLPDAGQNALVVGCGLGDDAEELARRGWAVTAFDISPTAIQWCRRRFPGSPVDYQVADLFDTPPTWRAAFDFVLEYFTIQALPPALCQKTIAAVARHVAPGGSLLVICLGRNPETSVTGPPWPLSKNQLDYFEQCGLTTVSFKEYARQANSPIRRFRTLYHRLAA